MRGLNRAAAEALSALGGAASHAVTDVTGFGLLGHAWEMADRSGAPLGVERPPAALSRCPGRGRDRRRYRRRPRNRDYLAGQVAVDPGGHRGLLRPPDVRRPARRGGPVGRLERRAGLAAAGFVAIGRVVEGPAAVRLL